MSSMISLEDFAAVRVALGQRVADAKFLAKGRANVGPAMDPESMMLAGETIDVVPTVYHLTYEAESGEISQRVVTVRRIERTDTSFYIEGRCHLRRMNRRFVVDRILECYDITTGELFGDPATYFSHHPIYASTGAPHQQALRLCRHELTLLTVVGASDGLFDPDEQDVVLGHVFNRCTDLELDEGEMRGLLALIAPDMPAFSSSIHQLKTDRGGDRLALRRSLRRLVDADGVVSDGEFNFVCEIENQLGLNAAR